MKDFAIWAWIIVLGILTAGWWFFIIPLIMIIVYVVIIYLRPEWEATSKKEYREIKKNRLDEAVHKRYNKLIEKNQYPENAVIFEKISNGKLIVDMYWLSLKDHILDESFYKHQLFRVDFKLTDELDGIIIRFTKKFGGYKGCDLG